MKLRHWGLAGLFASASLVSQAQPIELQLEASTTAPLIHSSQIPAPALTQFTTKQSSQDLFKKIQEGGSSHITLPLPSGAFNIKIDNQVEQLNGDITVIGSLLQDTGDHRVIATFGKDGAIIDIRGPGANYRGVISHNQLEMTQLDHPSMAQFSTPDDSVESLHQLSPELIRKVSQANQEPTSKETGANELVVVDAYLIYTVNIANRYPNGLAETLLNQLMATTNQAFVDSGTSVYLRLVGSDLVDYPKPSDFSALDDLRNAVRGVQTDPSLDMVFAKRDSLGADLVAMIRTHDLNEREVCGVAYFPTTDNNILINISNVGMSGGSYCYDTFTHEVGHNFGAGHQWRNGESVGIFDHSGAWIVADKWNTIMSSIGTGDVNRNYGLNKFSNPDIVCGGLPCGHATSADNARTIDALAPQNADLKPSKSEVTVNPYQVSELDTDNDGVIDNLDAFPFDPTETADSDSDGYGDNSDVFPQDANEWLDTDGDGTGNNSDTDDDNDGVADTSDALPLDPNETNDADSDGVGANSDALDNNPYEYQDSDADNIGNRLDTDDDNDGVADWSSMSSMSESDMFVVSAGNNTLFQYDLNTSTATTIHQTGEGGYNFRSELAVSPSGELYVIDYSDVARYDRLTQQYEIVIDRADIVTNFPTHMVFDSEFDLILNSGLGNSTIAKYTQGQRWANGSDADEAVFRDMLLLSEQRLLVASRSMNQVVEFDMASLSPSSIFIDQSGLNKPEHMIQLADGSILISQAGDHSVRQYSSSGNSIGQFIAAGSNGLGQIGCLANGPDGDIYVCSLDTDEIMQFNGSTGAFVGVVMNQSHGLVKPVSIAFAGAMLDSEPFNPNNDSDGDGVANIDDQMPLDPNETLDTDGDGIGNNTDTDDDGDGMPDSFEITYGLDPLNPSDASADNDGDGRTNLQEYQDQTDPTDASSVKKKKSSGSTHWFLLFGLMFLFLRKGFARECI
jgi:hypothetical protein